MLYILLAILALFSIASMRVNGILSLLLTLPGVLVAITFHEFAHAFAADKLGDDTPRMQGRLNLNPLNHLDPIGFFILLFVHIGWGKPVQINPRNFDRKISMSAGEAIVSFAGPLMNFILAIVFTIIYFTIFMNRTFFHPPLPPMLTPSYFILLAPLGLGLVSYVQLTGKVDGLAYTLYGLAFYVGLLFIFQWKRFVKLPFFISWWAYLFPTAAVTNATIYMYQETDETLFMWLIPIQLAGLLILAIYLLIKTTKLAMNGFLFVKEE